MIWPTHVKHCMAGSCLSGFMDGARRPFAPEICFAETPAEELKLGTVQDQIVR